MVRIRTMTEADAVAGIRVGGWRTAYAGLVPQSRLDTPVPEVRHAMALPVM
ncbi:hypothetical protein [Streptomyces sp. KLMMK]|uniref:hypothetical protein n=1 Tax=Streptomyces sp. KLMMK TaxID=3109353 RepID=UPI003FA6D8D8